VGIGALSHRRENEEWLDERASMATYG